MGIWAVPTVSFVARQDTGLLAVCKGSCQETGGGPWKGEPVTWNSMKTKQITLVQSATEHPQTPKKGIAHLIGNWCIVSCFFNGLSTEMLLDSGAQVTMVSKAWLESMLPHIKIQSLQSLFTNQSLEISAANGTEMPFMDGQRLNWLNRSTVKTMDLCLSEYPS